MKQKSWTFHKCSWIFKNVHERSWIVQERSKKFTNFFTGNCLDCALIIYFYLFTLIFNKVVCKSQIWPLFLCFPMQTLKIRHSATNKSKNLRSGQYEPNIKIFTSAKYHLYNLLNLQLCYFEIISIITTMK